MISNQILQNTIEGIKGITKIELYVMDTDGNVLAETSADAIRYGDSIQSFVDSPADSQVLQGYQFFKIYDEGQLEYIVVAKGDSEEVYTVGKIVAFQIQTLLVAYKERYDKDNFIKNLLLDNLLLVDIFNRSKKLHIEMVARRVVYIIETSKEKDTGALETVRGMFAGGGNKDFITAVDEKNIIVVKELAEKYNVDIMTMTGFLDGINESLKEANPIEEMEEDTQVSLAFEKELLYKNMVAAGADWLYELPEYPNDPCPCGSGKKYKKCCGKKG